MNARKARQLRSQGGQKRLRRFRKDVRAAEDALRAEYAEAEAARQEQYEAAVAQLAEEPQFAIINPFNGETLVVAAQSMIWPLGVNGKGEPLDDPFAGDGATAEEAAAENARIEQETAEYYHGDETPKYTEADTLPVPTPKIILPGTAEALGIERP